jgi:hypothetical protein
VAHIRDPLDGYRIRVLILLDPHATRSELGDGGADIGHPPGKLGLRVCRPDCARGNRQLGPATAPEHDPVALVLSKNLEPEHLVIERPTRIEVG